MTVTAQLKGGLGNQLFQYALAKAISERNGQKLLLNSHWHFNTPSHLTPRIFLLDHLRLHSAKVINSPWPPLSSFFSYLLSLLPCSSIVFDKDPYAYSASIASSKFEKKRNICLVGYWQSFKYFAHIRPLLLEEFQLNKLVDPHYTGFQKAIENSESVMIHIRRSDFINLKSAKNYHGALDISYYLKAIDFIKARIADPHFFIFSDDLEWSKNNIPKEMHATFIVGSTKDDAVVQELQLMRLCKHHIIANSSLSWWGAWLSEQQSQYIKICPDCWLKTQQVNLDDLLPSNWTRLPAVLL